MYKPQPNGLKKCSVYELKKGEFNIEHIEETLDVRKYHCCVKNKYRKLYKIEVFFLSDYTNHQTLQYINDLNCKKGYNLTVNKSNKRLTRTIEVEIKYQTYSDIYRVITNHLKSINYTTQLNNINELSYRLTEPNLLYIKSKTKI